MALSATTPLARCEISYQGNPDAGAIPRVDQECGFTLRLSNGSEVVDRAFSCRIPAGQSECALNLDEAIGTGGWRVFGAWAQPYVNARDVSRGCAYAGGGPSVRFDPKRDTVLVRHRYACSMLTAQLSN